MVIGTGDIAKTLIDEGLDRDNVTFFASGVSNSSETRRSEFDRELSLLLGQPPCVHLVYFSSLCIYYSNSEYAEHKKRMEQEVKTYFKSYTIVRIGNITFGNNSTTLLNFFRNKIRNKETVQILDAYRYLVSKEELQHWLKFINVGVNNEMNIPGKMMKVEDIYFEILNGRL